MAPVIIPALITAGVATGVAAFVGTTIALTTVFATTFALSAISGLLAPRPKSASGAALSFTVEARDRLQVVRSAVADRRVVYGQAMVSGPLVYAESTGSTNAFLHLVIPLAGHEVDEIGDVYFNDDLVGSLDGSGNVISGVFAGSARIKKHLGATDQSADADLVAESAGLWTTSHRLRGVAYIYVRLLFSQDVYPSGIPNIKSVVKGKKVVDPRVSPTEAAWSDNWALCVRDYLTSNYGLGADDSEIDDASVIAAANIADEQVELDAESPSTYQSRYTCNGTVSLGERPVEALRSLASAAVGTVTFGQGVWRVLAGAYQTPTVTIDEDWLRGSVQMQARPTRRDLFNTVRGTFSNPAKFWQPTDFPQVTNSGYVTNDGGEDIVRDIELPFTTNEIMAQRIARIHLEKSRQGITVQMPCNLRAFQVAIWDTVQVTLDDFGWVAKDFIVTAWEMAPDGNGVDLTMQEEASAVYDWQQGFATVNDPAPDTILPTPFTVPSPGAPSIVEELYETRDGRGVANKLVISWVAAVYPYGLSYQLEYRVTAPAGSPSTEAAYTVLPLVRSTTTEILDVASGYYDFRVVAISTLGPSSDYASTLAFEIFGLAAAPPTPQGLTIQVAGGMAILMIEKATALDVLRGGRLLVRHSEALTGQSWEESFSIGHQESWPGDSVLLWLPLKPGSYLVKARDSTGQESDDFAVVTTKQASVLAYSPVNNLQEDSTFSGTHINTVVSGVNLQLDVLPGSPTETDVLPSGYYEFASGFDFGFGSPTEPLRVRVSGEIQGIVFNTSDLIDSRTDLIDNWLNFDGDVGIGSAADAWLELRETDDDPHEVSPGAVWSDWKRLDAAEYEARGMEFRLQMRSFDPAYNIAVDTLRVRAEEVL